MLSLNCGAFCFVDTTGCGRRAKLELRQIRKEPDAIQRAADHAFGKASDVSRQLGGKHEGGRPEGDIEKSSRDLGIPASNIRRAIKIAGLSSAAKYAARSHNVADNQKSFAGGGEGANARGKVRCDLEEAKSDPNRFSRTGS